MRFTMKKWNSRRACSDRCRVGSRSSCAGGTATQVPTLPDREEFRRTFMGFLRDFLDEVGQPWWAEWVQIALDDGRFPDPSRSKPPFTLDEVVLTNDESNQVRPHLLPWANALLDCLRCILHRLESESIETDIATPCRECLRYSRGSRSQDALRLAVRRAVELACRQARFGPLLILDRHEGEAADAAKPVDIFPLRDA